MHELGHAADSQHGIVETIWQEAQKRARFAKRFSDAVSDFATAEKIDASDANDLVTSRLRAWITETFCDCVAAHHLGSTYLYSFLAEVAAGSMDEPGVKHPPPRQRIRLIVNHLDGMAWGGVIDAEDARLNAWIRRCVSERPRYVGVDHFLTWAMEELSPVVRKQTKKLLGKRVFAPDTDELAEVMTLLQAGIPPAQRRTGGAVSPESIILACWHVALARAGNGPAALAQAPDAPELADILPAALELSALTRAWISQ